MLKKAWKNRLKRAETGLSAFSLVFFGMLCQNRAMKFVISLFFLFLLPAAGNAQDFDSFVLSYQSVQVLEDNIAVELIFEQPKKHKFETVLKKGALLNLVIQTDLLQKRFFKDKFLTTHTLTWYLRYDPLTRQFSAIQDAKTIARNADAVFLLDVIIKHIQFEIPWKIEKNTEYSLHIKIDLVQSNAKSWLSPVQMIESDKVIQPFEFDYDFSS